MTSYYFDTLFLRIIDELGALPIVDPPQPDPSNQIAAVAEAFGNGEDDGDPVTVSLQVRVSPEARNAVRSATDASGVKKTYYLEGFIKKLIAEHGSLPLVDGPRRDRGNQIEAIRNLPEVTRSTAA